MAGISTTTFYRWRTAGQEAAVARADAIEAGRAVAKESALVTAKREFWEATERALGQQEAGYLQVIAAAATGGATFTEVRREVEHVRLPDGRVEARVVRETRTEHVLRPTWQAAAWIIERRHPERWSLRGRLELSGPPGGGDRAPGQRRPRRSRGPAGGRCGRQATGGRDRPQRQHRRGPMSRPCGPTAVS